MTKINDEQLRILAYVAEHPNVQADTVRRALTYAAATDRLYALTLRGF